MMSSNFFTSLAVLAAAAAALAFWWSAARAREHAVEHARLACRRNQVQFLDQSVALERLAPSRNKQGSVGWKRTFVFEFADHEAFRDRARVTMQGPTLVRVHFPWRRDEDGNRVFEH